MPKCALPDHLKDKLHNDWIWPLNKIPRALNAFGPRCKPDSKGYLPWPPKLVTGFDITRWEWSDLAGNRREIFIGAFFEKKINHLVYEFDWEAVEIIIGKSKVITVDLNDDWWPSVIPTTSKKGWLKLSPYFQCGWRTKPAVQRYYWRIGYRPDFDYYYNWGSYLGRNTE